MRIHEYTLASDVQRPIADWNVADVEIHTSAGVVVVNVTMGTNEHNPRLMESLRVNYLKREYDDDDLCVFTGVKRGAPLWVWCADLCEVLYDEDRDELHASGQAGVW